MSHLDGRRPICFVFFAGRAACCRLWDGADLSCFHAQSRLTYELFGGPLRPVGFLNEGNQCYRNVLLQSLLTLPRFVDEILEHDVHTGTIVYSATAFQQIKGMIIAVAEGRAFQPSVNSFRGEQEEDVIDYFQKLVLN